MMPSPSDLTYFIEVATTSNVSRAAERLGISQPSVTLALQRLEDSIGTQLFIRSKKGVTLTQAGKQLLVHAKDLVQRWDVVKSQALASTQDIQGSYTLGCHASVALYSLSKFLPKLLEEHPKLEIKLQHDLSRKILEKVIRMEIDIGIAVNPVKHPDLVLKKLCDDEVTFWIGKGNHKTQDFKSGEAVLICDSSLLQTQDLVKKIKKSGIQYSRVLETSSLEVITELTSSGAGIGVIPGRVAEAGLGKGLRKIAKAPIFHDEVYMAYRMENKNVKSIQEITERISAAFSAN